MKNSVKSIANIKAFFSAVGIEKGMQVFYAVDENCTINRLKKNPAGEVLLVAYPSFVRTGKQDNKTYQSEILFWVMEKWNTGNLKYDEEDGQYDRLLAKTFDIIDYMEDMASEQPCGFAGTVKFETIEIIPVYNTFSAYNGWFVKMIM